MRISSYLFEDIFPNAIRCMRLTHSYWIYRFTTTNRRPAFKYGRRKTNGKTDDCGLNWSENNAANKVIISRCCSLLAMVGAASSATASSWLSASFNQTIRSILSCIVFDWCMWIAVCNRVRVPQIFLFASATMAQYVHVVVFGIIFNGIVNGLHSAVHIHTFEVH